MVKYQPGGTAQKSQLLSYLASPSQVSGNSASAKGLRRWRGRAATELELMVSDPSSQLKGLGRLARALAPTGTFQVQTFRTQALLGQAPSQQSVLQFPELLLADSEDAVLGEAAEKGPKRPNVSKTDGAERERKGEGQGGKSHVRHATFGERNKDVSLGRHAGSLMMP